MKRRIQPGQKRPRLLDDVRVVRAKLQACSLRQFGEMRAAAARVGRIVMQVDQFAGEFGTAVFIDQCMPPVHALPAMQPDQLR